MKPLLIAGQGLAGTLLAWEFEQAGFDFEIADPGGERASSFAAAGIVNPVTGQRLVKSVEVDRLLPTLPALYGAMEQAMGAAFFRPMRVWREFRNDRERQIFATKSRSGELAPYVTADPARPDIGFWTEPAYHLNVPVFLTAARTYWQRRGRLTERWVNIEEEARHRDLVIACVGAWDGPLLSRARLDRSKGETLQFALRANEVPAHVVRNRGTWLLPLPGDRAQVGSTYDHGAIDLTPSPDSRARLAQAAEAWLGRPVEVDRHLAGWRISPEDRLPVVGRWPEMPSIGVANGLGSKAALFAPWLARQWVNHLTEGVPFDPRVDVRRCFLRRPPGMIAAAD